MSHDPPRTLTFRYIEPQDTFPRALEWCAARNLKPINLEVGPDGLVRGIAEIPEVVA